MAQGTKQRTASAPMARPNVRAPRPSATTGPSTDTAIPKVTRQHDGAPGLGSPIFDELVAELGDPRG